MLFNLANVKFLWIPGTGESYAGDERTDVIATNTMGSSVAKRFGTEIDSIWVGYDSTYGPAGPPSAGTGGQSYYESKAIAKAALLGKAREQIAAADAAGEECWLIFGGYSQGAAAAWEVMQEIYAGKHPDLWPRMLTSFFIANPMRPKPTPLQWGFIPDNVSNSITGWGVANRLGTGIKPRMIEIEVINPGDMITNTKANAIVRDIADLTEYFELNETADWGQQVFDQIANIDWVGAAASWVNVIEQVQRIDDLIKDLYGFMFGKQHVTYANRTRMPYTKADGTVVSVAEGAADFLVGGVAGLIQGARNRGPNPPVAAYEEFNVNQTGGWTNFVSGNLSQARVGSNRAGLVGTNTGVNALAYGVHKTPANTDNYAISVKLADVLQGTLDTGTAGSAMYLRIRPQSTWGVGTAVEVRIRASGAVTLSTVNGTTLTQKASGSGAIRVGDRLVLSANENVYKLTNETMGTTLVSWTDVNHEVTIGEANRYGGMTQTSNKPVLQTQWSCFAVDSFEIIDIFE